jgi:hypothetical protein
VADGNDFNSLHKKADSFYAIEVVGFFYSTALNLKIRRRLLRPIREQALLLQIC